MTGLDHQQLAQQTGAALPAREQMSLMNTGSGMGLVDAGTTDTTSGTGDNLLGGTDAAASDDPSTATAQTGDSYTQTAQPYTSQAQDDLDSTTSAAPAENDGEYSATKTTTAVGD